MLARIDAASGQEAQLWFAQGALNKWKVHLKSDGTDLHIFDATASLDRVHRQHRHDRQWNRDRLGVRRIPDRQRNRVGHRQRLDGYGARGDTAGCLVSGTYANAIASNGNLTCAQVAYSSCPECRPASMRRHCKDVRSQARRRQTATPSSGTLQPMEVWPMGAWHGRGWRRRRSSDRSCLRRLERILSCPWCGAGRRCLGSQRRKRRNPGQCRHVAEHGQRDRQTRCERQLPRGDHQRVSTSSCSSVHTQSYKRTMHTYITIPRSAVQHLMSYPAAAPLRVLVAIRIAANNEATVPSAPPRWRQ